VPAARNIKIHDDMMLPMTYTLDTPVLNIIFWAGQLILAISISAYLSKEHVVWLVFDRHKYNEKAIKELQPFERCHTHIQEYSKENRHGDMAQHWSQHYRQPYHQEDQDVRDTLLPAAYYTLHFSTVYMEISDLKYSHICHSDLGDMSVNVTYLQTEEGRIIRLCRPDGAPDLSEITSLSSKIWVSVT
jgi:hypothetical protein